jgi:hypothetical protein
VPAVSFDFRDRRSAERFAELLDENTGGGRHSHDPADEQLAELVAIGHTLTATRPEIQVDADFRVGLRAMLVATAERDASAMAPSTIGSATVGLSAAPASDGGGGLRGLILGRGGRRIRARGAIVIGVAVGALAVSGISAASENASPGDALYGVKRSTERAQLAMAGSDVTRGQLSLDFARTRLNEAAAMAGNAAGFPGVLDDMDADTRKGVRLLNTSAVARRDVKPLGTVDAFVERQRQTLMTALDRLSPANQERAAASLSLLDTVGRRADDLRTGLNCATVQSAGSDTLGPRLRDCTTTTEGAATGKPAGRSGKATTRQPGESKAKAERANPSAAPTSTTDATSPDTPASSTAPALPLGGTPVTSAPPADTTTDDTDSVGGLLGELFGIH